MVILVLFINKIIRSKEKKKSINKEEKKHSLLYFPL